MIAAVGPPGSDLPSPRRAYLLLAMMLGRAPSECSYAGSVLQEPGLSVRPYHDTTCRRSRQNMVGKVPVGGDAPIAVQSMANTLTSDIEATIGQVRRREETGGDSRRVS